VKCRLLFCRSSVVSAPLSSSSFLFGGLFCVRKRASPRKSRWVLGSRPEKVTSPGTTVSRRLEVFPSEG
jgi:hypothetical protein